MYQLVEPSLSITIKGLDEKIAPIATLKDEYGGICHIIEDDHCFVVCLEKADGISNPTTHLFKEVIEAIKTLKIPA